MSVDKRDQIRTAMALPNKLFTDDGRELKIQHWSPTVSTGDQLINVTVAGFIALKPAKPKLTQGANALFGGYQPVCDDTQMGTPPRDE